MNVLEYYYLEKWNEFYSEQDGGKYYCFKLDSKFGKIVYPMIIRKIDVIIDGIQFCDIVTPKGYTGPTIVECKKDCEQQLIEEYTISFLKFCKENNIVSEYVRFNPWKESYRFFSHLYEISCNGTLFGINLKVDDIFLDEIPSKTRNTIRKSEKEGVVLSVDYQGETLGEFLRLYNFTVNKNNISEYYQFTYEKLEKYFNMIKDESFIINAKLNDKIISSAMFIIWNDKIYYNYSATNPEFYYTNSVSAIIYEACVMGKKVGCEMMELGSGSTENLKNFKKSFSKSGLVFSSMIGKAIRNLDVYNKLVELKKDDNINQNYFPKYRG